MEQNAKTVHMKCQCTTYVLSACIDMVYSGTDCTVVAIINDKPNHLAASASLATHTSTCSCMYVLVLCTTGVVQVYQLPIT